MPEHLVLMVGANVEAVERELAGGELSCPGCGQVLGPWGWARGRRVSRGDGSHVCWRPRRGRCRACRATHVLWPGVLLLRRMYEPAVIGAALEAKAAGATGAGIAHRLGVARSTVRGWITRLTARAEFVRAHFTRWMHWCDASASPILPRASPFADAVAAVGAAAHAATMRVGDAPVWQFRGGGVWRAAVVQHQCAIPRPVVTADAHSSSLDDSKEQPWRTSSAATSPSFATR